MDMDEFLEKETGQKSNDTETPKTEPANPLIPEKPKEAPAEVNTEGSIVQFQQFWSKISDTKLKWDSKLYSEVSETAEKAKQELYKSSINLDKEKKTIKYLIGKALDQLDKKNYDEASKLFSDIGAMRDKIPDFMMEEKKELDKEIFSLSQKLHEGIDRAFTGNFWSSVNKIETTLKDAFLSFDAADLERAKSLYDQALQDFKSLPNGFTQKKLGIGENLLKLYKDLSIQLQINELQQQLSIKGNSYKGINGYEKLRQLADSAESIKGPINGSVYGQPKSTHVIQPLQLISDRSLLNRLIIRKLDRARINLKKELYHEAKRNLDSVLRVDPENKEAKKLLGSMPIKV